MSVVNNTVADVNTYGSRSNVFVWPALANGDTGLPIEIPGLANRSVQVTGTFGAGGSITMQGSNDGSNWATLTDGDGNNITITAAKIENIYEFTRYVRPSVTAGDGTTALTITLVGRRSL